MSSSVLLVGIVVSAGLWAFWKFASGSWHSYMDMFDEYPFWVYVCIFWPIGIPLWLFFVAVRWLALKARKLWF
jgi:hypothetical protein